MSAGEEQVLDRWWPSSDQTKDVVELCNALCDMPKCRVLDLRPSVIGEVTRGGLANGLHAVLPRPPRFREIDLSGHGQFSVESYEFLCQSDVAFVVDDNALLHSQFLRHLGNLRRLHIRSWFHNETNDLFHALRDTPDVTQLSLEGLHVPDSFSFAPIWQNRGIVSLDLTATVFYYVDALESLFYWLHLEHCPLLRLNLSDMRFLSCTRASVHEMLQRLLTKYLKTSSCYLQEFTCESAPGHPSLSLLSALFARPTQPMRSFVYRSHAATKTCRRTKADRSKLRHFLKHSYPEALLSLNIGWCFPANIHRRFGNVISQNRQRLVSTRTLALLVAYKRANAGHCLLSSVHDLAEHIILPMAADLYTTPGHYPYKSRPWPRLLSIQDHLPSKKERPSRKRKR